MKKKKAVLRIVGNFLLFILLIVLTFWIIFKDQNITELIKIVKSAKSLYVILGIILMFLFHLTEAYNLQSILKWFDEKISLLKALKFTLIGFFFSSITPAASGGQPVEIYYMTKEKISGAKSTISLLVQLCGYQISTISFGIICAILNPAILKGGLIWLFLLGLTINGFALSIMLICVFSKKITQKIITFAIGILKFFRVKNIEDKKQRLEAGVEKYNNSSFYIKTHKKEFIKAILRVFLQIAFYYSVPFCVYKAFGLNSYNLYQIFTMQAVLYTTVSSLPLPGAIGISEAVFLAIFEPAFGSGLLNGAMLLSRGITFYLYVIVSLIVVIFNALKMKNIKVEFDEEFNKNEK